MEPKKYNVFISYSRLDKKVVFPFVEKLNKEHCINSWIDLEGIESGEQFEDVIIHAINSSEIVLFMLSDNSLKSDWTKREVYYAEGEKKRIVPIVIDKKGLRGWFKFHFGNVDFIDISSKEQCDKLYGHLQRWISNNGEKTSNGIIATNEDTRSLTRKPMHKRKTFLWAVMSLMMLIVIAIGFIAFCNRGDDNIATVLVENDDSICQPVDLGLPSRTLWGDRNVGAESPTDFGNLYAWGELNVATTELGRGWTMPTEEQFKELLSECKWYWKKKNGHNGYDIVGKNGMHLFLPAAGWNRGTDIEYQNQYGYYWTLERSSNTRFARSLQFPKDGKGIVGNGDLYVGRSVRAVFVEEAVAE